MRISAVLNVKNEEVNLRFCLECLRWCDEIVVVDMESSDRTVEIAREYTDKVFHHAQVLEFDEARRFAVENASGDWVLMVDADEMVPFSLAQRLEQISSNDEVDVVFLPFKTYIMGAWIRHTLWWPDYHPRFFRRDSLKLGAELHNFLQPMPESRVLYLPARVENAVFHFNYRDVSHFLEKLNIYTSIEAFALAGREKSFSLCEACWLAFKEFVNRYFRFHGYRDGLRGLVLSILMSLYRFITCVKLWEAEQRHIDAEFDYLRVRRDLVREHGGPAKGSLP